MAKVPFTIRIEPKERRALRNFAALRKKTTASELVRKAMANLLRDAIRFETRSKK